MADPITLVGAIAATAQLASEGFELASKLRSLLKTINNADSEAKWLAERVSSTSATLLQFKENLETEKKLKVVNQYFLSQVEGVLHRCGITFETLKKALTKAHPGLLDAGSNVEDFVSRKRDRIAWAYTSKDIKLAGNELKEMNLELNIQVQVLIQAHTVRGALIHDRERKLRRKIELKKQSNYIEAKMMALKHAQEIREMDGNQTDATDDTIPPHTESKFMNGDSTSNHQQQDPLIAAQSTVEANDPGGEAAQVISTEEGPEIEKLNHQPSKDLGALVDGEDTDAHAYQDGSNADTKDGDGSMPNLPFHSPWLPNKKNEPSAPRPPPTTFEPSRPGLFSWPRGQETENSLGSFNPKSRLKRGSHSQKDQNKRKIAPSENPGTSHKVGPSTVRDPQPEQGQDYVPTCALRISLQGGEWVKHDLPMPHEEMKAIISRFQAKQKSVSERLERLPVEALEKLTSTLLALGTGTPDSNTSYIWTAGSMSIRPKRSQGKHVRSVQVMACRERRPDVFHVYNVEEPQRAKSKSSLETRGDEKSDQKPYDVRIVSKDEQDNSKMNKKDKKKSNKKKNYGGGNSGAGRPHLQQPFSSSQWKSSSLDINLPVSRGRSRELKSTRRKLDNNSRTSSIHWLSTPRPFHRRVSLSPPPAPAPPSPPPGLLPGPPTEPPPGPPPGPPPLRPPALEPPPAPYPFNPSSTQRPPDIGIFHIYDSDLDQPNRPLPRQGGTPLYLTMGRSSRSVSRERRRRDRRTERKMLDSDSEVSLPKISSNVAGMLRKFTNVEFETDDELSELEGDAGASKFGMEDEAYELGGEDVGVSKVEVDGAADES